MHQIYSDQACENILTDLLAGMADFEIHLFTNNLTVDRNNVIGDFIEPAWAGYASVTVAPGDFTISTSGHLTTALASPITFENTSGSGQNAYGYYVTNSAGDLIAAARFDGAPITIPDGGTYPVVPIIGDFSQYAS